MREMLDNYRARVVTLLSSGMGKSHSRLAEVLCLPSFHPEVLLRVENGPSGTTFRLATCTSSLWYSLTGHGEWPGRLEESAHVPPARAARFWADLDAFEPQAIRDSTAFGIDGMGVRCSWRVGEAMTSFEAWSPAPDTKHGAFIGQIYDLAWEQLQERFSIERLEQLHGYLRLGLPVRWISGEVRCLRIFGHLSSQQEDDLRSFFASVPGGEPLVVDMTNFEGMGTLLHPAFVNFASGRRVAWAVSEAARQHVESMRLPDAKLFDRAEDAVSWMAGTEVRPLT